MKTGNWGKYIASTVAIATFALYAIDYVSGWKQMPNPEPYKQILTNETQTRPLHSDLLTTEAAQDLEKKRPELFGEDFKKRASEYFKYLGGPEVTEEETEELRRIFFGDPLTKENYKEEIDKMDKLMTEIEKAGGAYPYIVPCKPVIYVDYWQPELESGDQAIGLLVKVIRLAAAEYDNHEKIKITVYGDADRNPLFSATTTRLDVINTSDDNQLFDEFIEIKREKGLKKKIKTDFKNSE